MLDTAIAKLATYDGTNPADVRDALARRFKASSSAFAMWITFNLRFLRVLAPRSEYVCQKVYYDCGGLCQEEAPYAWAPICGALAPVRVCDPRYFGAGDTDRPMYLIHEWVHKYGCNFDLGYCSESDCPGGTVRSLLNADPWARLVGDIARTAKRSRLDGCRRAGHPGHYGPPLHRRRDGTCRGCPDVSPATRQPLVCARRCIETVAMVATSASKWRCPAASDRLDGALRDGRAIHTRRNARQ